MNLFTLINGILSNGTAYPLHPGSSNPLAISFSPDGRLLATANGDHVVVFTINWEGTLNARELYRLPPGSSHAGSLKFSPDGLFLVTSNKDSSAITIFPVKDGKLGKGISYALPPPHR